MGQCMTALRMSAVPEVLRHRGTGRWSSSFQPKTPPEVPPHKVMNVPSVLVELRDQQQNWQAGQSVHVGQSEPAAAVAQ